MAKTIHTPEPRWVIRSKAKNEEGDYVFVNEDFVSDDDWLPTLFMSKEDALLECDPDEEPVMVKVVWWLCLPSPRRRSSAGQESGGAQAR